MDMKRNTAEVPVELERASEALQRIERMLYGQAEGYANSGERIGLDLRLRMIYERLGQLDGSMRLMTAALSITCITVITYAIKHW